MLDFSANRENIDDTINHLISNKENILSEYEGKLNQINYDKYNTNSNLMLKDNTKKKFQ